ncbi:AtpZ/AtpI family protein [Halothiobacillus sp.]|uniref:AtpZ/AtpI family protein n=1 Tax=Halothiobacillus sp. TaxID=1891311 RepID=UPI002AD2B04E|nr:AtpZ/AtpI family protein [Halothiobacillus sp.]
MAEQRDTSQQSKSGAGTGYLAARFQGLLNVGAGNIFASTVIAGLLLGFLVDRWLGWAPICMLLGGLSGFIGGMKNAHRLMLASHHDDNV